MVDHLERLACFCQIMSLWSGVDMIPITKVPHICTAVYWYACMWYTSRSVWQLQMGRNTSCIVRKTPITKISHMCTEIN